MPRSVSNYDSIAYGMEAIMNDEAHKSVFERPVIKEASAQEDGNKEQKKHPVHTVLENLVEASSTLDAMGLNKSAAELLRAADLIVAEATGVTQDVKPGEAKGNKMPAGDEEPADGEKIEKQKADEMNAEDDLPSLLGDNLPDQPAPLPGHVPPGEAKPTPLPAGGEKPAEDEKPGMVPAEPMNAMDYGFDEDGEADKKDKEKEEKERKALEVVQDLINKDFPEEPGPSEWKDPAPDSEVEPIYVVEN